MKFLKRLFNWAVTKSPGSHTAGAGAVGIPIVAALSAAGFAISPELAATIPAVLSILTAVGKDN